MVDKAAEKCSGVFLQQYRRRCLRKNGSRRGLGLSASLTRTGSRWRHRLKGQRHWRWWLDHERQHCNLERRSDNLVLGSVDDGAVTTGRATQTRSLIRKKKHISKRPAGTISGAPSDAPILSPSHPPVKKTDREKGIAEAADEIESPRQVGPSALLEHDGRGGSEGSTTHSTRALPPAEIDLPGGGTTVAAAEV